MRAPDRSVNVLASLVRKQAWDIAHLRSGLAQAHDLVTQLSTAIENLEIGIAETEAGLRFTGERSDVLSVDVIQRHRQFLSEQQQALTKVLHERQRAEALTEEFTKRLTKLRIEMRVYENLAVRRRDALAAEEIKANMRQLDELWLARIGE